MEVTHGRGYVYSIQYHIVWCVKYRHKILTPKIEKRLIEILNMIAEYENFQILECNTDKDHIHLLVNCSPQHYIPNIIQKLKGISSRLQGMCEKPTPLGVGWIAYLFYNSMCMFILFSYT